jgi:vacuolar-type H+-ATPase subunit I/STV1
MSPNSSFEEYQAFVTSRLRSFEEKRAKGDSDRLKQLELTPDTELLRKWMLIVSVGGFPVTFIFMMVLGTIGKYLPDILNQFFWLLAKGAMGITFVIFVLAVYFTIFKANEDGR